ncbi:9981_t:CDS:2 [Entrophospora sp. SA101]|nr:9981_t:CDS:2 [Entrophospora sp. SA101]
MSDNTNNPRANQPNQQNQQNQSNQSDQPNQPRQPNYPPSLTDAQKKAVEQPRNEKGQFDKKGTPINHYERYPYQPCSMYGNSM